MIEGSRSFESFPSRTGQPAGRYDGISLCSRHDPGKEAERIVPRRDKKARAALFLGFGMGYQVEAYLKATRDIPLIVAEKELSLLQEVSRIRDLSFLEESDRVYFFTDPHPDNLTLLLRELQVSRFDIIPHATLVPRYEEYYRGVKEAVNRWLDRREINMNTVTRFGRLWVRNLAANLPLLERGQALSRLKDRFSRIPALLVAAGPSLEDHLPHMKELAERALVIAVDTSCANLMKHGVIPDFLIVTDPQYWNTRHLDFCRPEGILVVSDTSVHPRTLRDFTGPLYLSRSPFPLASPLEEGLLDISLKSGGSVATAAWDLAITLGCDRIYCVGLDLGFPGKQTHCRGSFFEERVNYLSDRFSGPEQWSWQALHSAPLSIRGNYFGDKILSDQRMQVYVSWFSEHVRQSPGRTVNLSRRGALIEGMPYHSREDFLSLPVMRDRIEEIKGDLSRETENRGEDVSERISRLIASLDQTIGPVKRAEETARELENAFLDGKPLEELLQRLDRLDGEIAREAAREIGGFLIQPHLQAIEENQTAGGLGIIRNSLMLYGELLRSLRYHRNIFLSYS
jgi:hypothetical protein